jgi:hypothetical protein
MGIQDLTDGSDAIVYGRVLSLVPHWDDAHEMIYTTVTVQPIAYMKGDLGPDPIEFEMPGGTVGDVGLAVSDVPQFEIGEEAVLFLRPDYFRVVGWFQGKMAVENGVVLSTGERVETFGLRVMALSGLSGDGIRAEDGAIIMRAEVTLPAPAGDVNDAAPAPKSPPGEASPTGDVTVFSDDFEGAFPGVNWTVSDQNGTGHKWGKETYRVHGGSNSIWECAGGGSALPSGSDYANGMMTWAIYGPFDLSDATDAELVFWRSVETAGSGDLFYWMASDDGSSFSGFAAHSGSGTWTEETFSLGGYIGDGSVWIAFLFISDGSGTDKGAFVDDVEIVKTVPSGSSPNITNISPDNGASGTGPGFLVTITGTNFGATQGGSYVRFVWDPLGTPYVNADYIDSWSDTQVICNVPEKASSGMVNVVVGGDPGIGAQFTVNFGASNTSWAYMSEPMGEDILLNSTNSDVTTAEAMDAMVKGMQEWNAEGGAEFSFTYGGQTGVCTSAMNNINEICFASTGGSLATNYSWFVGSNLLENNIIFNDTGFTFSTDLSPGTYDIQAITTHELGHSLRLLDLYGTADVGKTMYGRIAAQQTGNRTIEDSEKDGIQYFYGPQTVNLTTRALPDATTPTQYSASLSSTGGTPPYTYALRSGTSLPANLSLAPDGTVSGYCQEAGDFYFTVRVTDNASNKDSQVIKLHIESSAPVALEQFTARPVDGGVLVEWSLADGSDPGDFYVHRSAGDENGRYDVLNDEPVIASDDWGRSYGFLDGGVVPGTLYFYKLEVREGLERNFLGPVSAVAPGSKPVAHWLGQNRPNPFSPAKDGVTVLTFSLPSGGPASVRIYDAAGRLVAVAFDGEAPSGETDVVWDGKGVNGAATPAGVYFYELSAPGFTSTRKLQIAR